jgi:dihydrofolate synthase/folylpolyglutamate synthase
VRTAVEQGSRLSFVGREWQYTIESLSLAGTRIAVAHGGERQTYDLAMLGAVQAENAALALAALAEAAGAGIPIPAEALQKGLATMQWPGRLQVIRQEPLVILDSAHNEHSARRLVEDLHALVGRRPLTFVLGFMADKDIDGMLTTLLPAANRVILTHAEHPRAVTVEKLRERVEAIGVCIPIAVIPAVSDAVLYALAEASPDEVVCVMGSLAVVGEALRLLERS